MLQQPSIKPGAPLKPEMDFFRMREEAMEVLQRLAGQTWTDYNLHDPGLTVLEQLCYALTDLGYRLNFSVPDLLADAIDPERQTVGWRKGLGESAAPTLPAMPSMEEVLPSAPTTLDDWRRVFLDVEGIRSVQMIDAQYGAGRIGLRDSSDEVHLRTEDLMGLRPLRIDGIFALKADIEEGRYRDATRAIWQSFHAQRPVGEDLEHITPLRPAQLQLMGEIDLVPGINVEESLAEAFLQIDRYAAPQAPFYTMGQLQGEGFPNDLIFEGPLLQSGFLKPKEVAATKPRQVLYLSRIIEMLFSIQGIKELRAIRLKGQHGQIVSSSGVQYWISQLADGAVARIDPDVSGLVLRVNGVMITADAARVRRLFETKRAQAHSRHAGTGAKPLELPRNRNIAAYQSLQHQFPETYGTLQIGLPYGSTALRKAQAHQFKTWLLFFEQILSDYFAKAGQLGRMFQLAAGENSTFEAGDLDDVPAVQESFLPLESRLDTTQDAETLQALRRLQRLLAHLVARFGHELPHFPSAALYVGSEAQQLTHLLRGQIDLYRDLPRIARDRGQGPDLLQSERDATAAGGLKTRIARLLGLRPEDPDLGGGRTLATAMADVDFLMIEHAMLRPIERDFERENMLFRFRNGKITRVVRLRSKADHETYILKCFSTGTSVLQPHDKVEINFPFRQFKGIFPVLEVGETYFVIPNDYGIGTEDNPQGGPWNKVTEEGANLYFDPWSLRLSFVFHRHDHRFAQAHQRIHVEQVLRREVPAHIAVSVEWMDHLSMSGVASDYYHWRQAQSQYLQDKMEGQVLGKQYVLLRHYRNALMRSIIPGETDSLHDLKFQVLPMAGLAVRTLPNGDVELRASGRLAADPGVVLPEQEPGVSYRIAVAAGPDDWDEPRIVDPVAGDGQAETPLRIDAGLLAPGRTDLALYAWDPLQQSGALFHQKIIVHIA